MSLTAQFSGWRAPCTFPTDFKWSGGSLLPVKSEPQNTSVSPCLKRGEEQFEING